MSDHPRKALLGIGSADILQNRDLKVTATTHN
jgi:hypothetical protein